MKLDIPFLEFGALSLLHHAGPTSQIELGGYLHMDKASVVKHVDNLEAKGLVVRSGDTKDRRVKFVSLTPKGKSLFIKAAKVRTQCENDFLKDLSSTERSVLLKAIPKLLK